MSNSFDPDQARHFVGLDLGPNCLQGLSADNKMSGWIVCNLSADNKSRQRVKYKKKKKLVDTTLAKVNFIWLQLPHMAKVLATTNSEPE